MIKYPLASVALVAAGALCKHTGPAGRVASPHLWLPQGSVGFNSAQDSTGTLAQLLCWGWESQRQGKERTVGKARSLLVPPALFASPMARGAESVLPPLCC